MKKYRSLLSFRGPLLLCSVICLLASARPASAQTLHVPGGTVGNISGSSVGIGTPAPGTKLHVYDGDLRVSDLGSGAVAQFILDSNSGTGDIAFFRQGSLKFMIRGEVDSDGSTLDFADRTTGSHVSRIYVAGTGSVGIGTTNPGGYKLAVKGTIHAQGVVVNQTGWSDYVFKPGYRLPSLREVEAHIQTHGTLPGVPSEAEVAKEGVNLGDMQARLLAKVEELTLHQIAQEKQLAAQARRIAALEQENARLRQKP